MLLRARIPEALVVKDLWERALLEVQLTTPTAPMLAALLGGVAMETALKAAYPEAKNTDTHKLIAQFEKDKRCMATSSDVEAAQRLRRLRNSVQHEGMMPQVGDARRHLCDAHSFVDDVVRAAFGVALSEICIAELVEDPLLEPALRWAYELRDEGNTDGVQMIVAACYEQVRFRVSEQMTTVRSPDKAARLRGLLPLKLASLSHFVFVDRLGLPLAMLTVGEVDLADKANWLLSLATIGFSASRLATLERLVKGCTRKLADGGDCGEADAYLDGLDAAAVADLLDYFTRQVWRLEETQPELFGLSACQEVGAPEPAPSSGFPPGEVRPQEEGSGMTTHGT